MSSWLICAVEAKHPKLTVALAHSVPLVVSEDKLELSTREMVAGDHQENAN